MAAKEFNRRMDGQGEFPIGTATACHPGIVDTVLAREYFKGEIPQVLHSVVTPIWASFLFYVKFPSLGRCHLHLFLCLVS